MNLKKILIDAQIVKQGHWILRSGKHSDVYINKDDIILDPMTYSLIVNMFATKILFDFRDDEYDGIVSPAVAGICFGAPVARQLGKRFVYPEKKHHPQIAEANRTEGDYAFVFRSNFQNYIEGRKFIIVEDIVTTALSTMKTVNAIEACGGEVIIIYCIWNRDPDGITYVVRNGDVKTGAVRFTVGKDEVTDGYLMPVRGLIEERVGDWKKEECPLCKQGIPLLDPKTMGIVSV